MPGKFVRLQMQFQNYTISLVVTLFRRVVKLILHINEYDTSYFVTALILKTLKSRLVQILLSVVHDLSVAFTVILIPCQPLLMS